ncbi:MAG: rRNA methyltransferase [Bacteroidetes bacterium]|nr:MAG: rRNA methyltransferase [Bacteroidota bacterium]
MLPKAFIERIEGQLGNETGLFLSALETESPVSIRINPYKGLQVPVSLEAIPWSDNGYYLPERPSFTLDPGFHSGMYYVQEASSMSLEFVLKQLPLEGALALDLCGAPGGKSTLLATALYEQNGMVLANEVIRARAQTLKENLIKWGLPNVAVSNLDPKHIAKSKLQFDLMLVDAPCSGEGMFRKDPAAQDEWSLDNVELCAARQKRILSDVLPALKDGGYLLYSTCTYSEAENEQNLRWLADEHELESLAIPFPSEWNITEKRLDNSIGYAFYPNKTKGEGFFIALLRKPGEAKELSDKGLKKPGKKVEAPLEQWLNQPVQTFEWFDGIYAVPLNVLNHASRLFHSLPLQYLGTRIAEPAGREWKPSPELAFSVIAKKETFSAVELSLKDALHFLRRDELKFPEQVQGWLRMEYKKQGLGYVKNLGNRSNSQYPKEWRILMSLPEELSTWY